MPKTIKAVRWTIEFAASEFGIPRPKLTLALKTADLRAGADGKYSTRQLISALFETVALEREAKAARHRQQIDEAEMTKLQREVEEGKLIERVHIREKLSDLLTQIAQDIRQSKITEKDRKVLLDKIRSTKIA